MCEATSRDARRLFRHRPIDRPTDRPTERSTGRSTDRSYRRTTVRWREVARPAILPISTSPSSSRLRSPSQSLADARTTEFNSRARRGLSNDARGSRSSDDAGRETTVLALASSASLPSHRPRAESRPKEQPRHAIEDDIDFAHAMENHAEVSRERERRRLPWAARTLLRLRLFSRVAHDRTKDNVRHPDGDRRGKSRSRDEKTAPEEERRTIRRLILVPSVDLIPSTRSIARSSSRVRAGRSIVDSRTSMDRQVPLPPASPDRLPPTPPFRGLSEIPLAADERPAAPPLLLARSYARFLLLLLPFLRSGSIT